MGASKRLERQDGIIAGVCGGLAAYLGWSPFLIRLLFFILLLPGGLPGYPAVRDSVDSHAQTA